MESLAILPPDTGEERSDLKQTSMTRTRLRTVDLAYAALFAVLLMVCAWINIPLTVPFTLQTFGVFAALGTRAFCWAPPAGISWAFWPRPCCIGA